MKRYEPGKKKVFVGEKELTFDQRVQAVVELEGRSILILDPDDFDDADPSDGRNILCYGHNGELLWRIEDSEMKSGLVGEEVPESFDNLILDEDGRVWTYNSYAYYTINPEDGSFLDSEWRDRFG